MCCVKIKKQPQKFFSLQLNLSLRSNIFHSIELFFLLNWSRRRLRFFQARVTQWIKFRLIRLKKKIPVLLLRQIDQIWSSVKSMHLILAAPVSISSLPSFVHSNDTIFQTCGLLTREESSQRPVASQISGLNRPLSLFCFLWWHNFSNL